MPNEALRALLTGRSTNMTPTGDGYLARRRADITSGLDDWMPSADSEEFKLAQLDAGEKSYGGGNVHYTPSRDALREGAMGKLRQVLGMQQQKQMGDIATAEAGQRAAMDRVLAAQQGQTYRTELQQGGSTARSEADRDSREALLNTRLGAMETQQAARDAAAMERAKFNQGSITGRQDKKLGSQGGWIGALAKMIFGGGNEEAPVEEAPVEEAPVEQPEQAQDPRANLRSRYGY